MKISGLLPSTTSFRVTKPGAPTSNERFFSVGPSSTVTGDEPTGLPLRKSLAFEGLSFTITTRVPSGRAEVSGVPGAADAADVAADAAGLSGCNGAAAPVPGSAAKDVGAAPGRDVS